MKRILLVFLVMALLVLSFGNAFAGGPAPEFGITTDGIKLGNVKVDTWRNGYHGLIVDGSNIYAVRVGGLFSEAEVVMDKSNDGGLTWLNSTGIARDSGIQGYGSGIAINPVTKSLHYVWAYGGPTYNGVYYGNGTITARVNGSVTNYEADSPSIAVDGNGVIHILFTDFVSIYYTSSSDSGLTFSEPAAIATGLWYSFNADSAGNLYLVYDNGHYFMKKPAGGAWSISYSACPSCSRSDPSMAVYDTNRIYFATPDGLIAATSDGGQTWTIYDAPNVATGGLGSLAVSSDGLLNYTWEQAGSVYFARTTKSNDLSSWGQTVLALAGGTLPNIAVDSAGKAHIMATKGNVAVFTREK
jgi:hypothetical protein